MNEYWKKKRQSYSQEDWATKPSLFVETVNNYLPKSGSILELGAGLGQDSTYFSNQGYKVVATDIELEGLADKSKGQFVVKQLDLHKDLPFNDSSFDVVYAHLSIHYFDRITTSKLFTEIWRVLKPNGVLAFLVNSKDDPEFNTGNNIEADYFEVDGTPKRFFDTQTAKEFTNGFKPLILDNKGETYKDRAKGIHNLIRYIGKKIDI